MTIQKSEAIVLKSVKFRETSLITTFFTSDFGKIKALSKGVRKERSAVLPNYELFCHVSLVFYEKTKSDIHFLSECALIDFFGKIRRDFEKVCWASYLAELADVALPPHEGNQALFRILLEVLNRMEKGSPLPLVVAFEMKLLWESGFFPRLGECLRCKRRDVEGYLSLAEGGIVCKRCRNILTDHLFLSKSLLGAIRFFCQHDLEECCELRPGEQVLQEIHALADRWVRYRLEKDLSTVRFLRQVDLIPQA